MISNWFELKVQVSKHEGTCILQQVPTCVNSSRDWSISSPEPAFLLASTKKADKIGAKLIPREGVKMRDPENEVGLGPFFPLHAYK